jgi:hypothetical protein
MSSIPQDLVSWETNPEDYHNSVLKITIRQSDSLEIIDLSVFSPTTGECYYLGISQHTVMIPEHCVWVFCDEGRGNELLGG